MMTMYNEEYVKTLIRAVELAQNDPKLWSMIQDWNNERDVGIQDMITSKIIRYVDEIDGIRKPMD
jgi:hypothetical protein